MLQNRIFISLTVMLVAITALTGCTKEEQSEMQTAAEHNAIRLTATMLPTRAVSNLQGTELSNTTIVGVYGLTDGNTILMNGDNAPYNADSDGSLSATGDAMMWPAGGSVSIYAYAPRQESWSYASTTKIFTVATNQSDDAGYLNSDLLYAKATPYTQLSSVGLSFSHKLARIVLTVTAGANTLLSDATVKIVGTKTSTALTLTDGYISEASGNLQDIIIGSGITLGKGQGKTLYGVIVPQSISSENTFIQIVTAQKTWKYRLTADNTFLSGKSYSFDVIVNLDQITSTINGEATEPALIRQK